MILGLFYNREERRLRAGWRLACVVAVILCGLAAAELLIGWPEEEGPMLVPGMMETAVIVGAVLFCGRFVDRRRLRDFGFRFGRAWWRDFGFGLALGVLLMGAVFLVELALGWVEVERVSASLGLAPVLLLFVCVGLTEELLVRGYILKNLGEGFFGPLRAPLSIAIALVISSVIFAGLHAFNPNASTTSAVNLAFAGLTLALGMLLTGELAIPIGLHITWNFAQGNLFGFPVSGIDAGPSVLELTQGGPERWTGGAFGPEAGWIGIAAEIAAMLLIVAWVRWTRGEVRLCRDLAVPELST